MAMFWWHGLLGPRRVHRMLRSMGRGCMGTSGACRWSWLERRTWLAGTRCVESGKWNAWVERSADGGKTWTKFGPITVPESADVPDAGAKAAGEQVDMVGAGRKGCIRSCI